MQGFQNALRFIHFVFSFGFIGILFYEHFSSQSSSKWLKASALASLITGLIYFIIKSFYLGVNSELLITPWWIFLIVGSLISVCLVFNILLSGGWLMTLTTTQKRNLECLSVIYILPLILCMMNSAHLYIEVSRHFMGWLLYLIIASMLCGLEYAALKEKWDFSKYNRVIVSFSLAVIFEIIIEIIAKIGLST
jgi:hypothetical protein